MCGNNLGRVSYEFSKYTGPAKEVFKIDTVECEIPLPKRMCHRCYNVIVRTQKARQEGRYYEHCVEVFTWGRHESEGECRICVHVSDHFKGGRPKKAQVGRSVSTSRELIIRQLYSVAHPSILPDDESRPVITTPPRSSLAIADLSCTLCKNILDRPIFLTTCGSLVCVQCCCSALREEMVCPSCGGDHIRDLQTVVPPSTVVTKALAGLEVLCNECGCKVRMGKCT